MRKMYILISCLLIPPLFQSPEDRRVSNIAKVSEEQGINTQLRNISHLHPSSSPTKLSLSFRIANDRHKELSFPSTTMLNTLSLLLALLPTTLGLNALFRPASALAIFQFPAPSNAYAHTLALGLMRIYGARNASIGLSCLAMWYEKQWRVMGWTFLAGCLMTLTDGFVAREVLGSGTGAEWTHWVFTPVGALLGMYLVRAGRER